VPKRYKNEGIPLGICKGGKTMITTLIMAIAVFAVGTLIEKIVEYKDIKEELENLRD
jgi:hypothetical protein